MDLKQIKDLMTAMGRTGVNRIAIKNEQFELELERDSMSASCFETESDFTPKSSLEDRALAKGSSMVAPVQPPEKEQGQYIHSPMVGTFYASSSPDEPPFVKVGDRVDANSVVCIIEAMKVMNEVKAGAAGQIVKVLVENGHPVEFGTKLFLVV